VEQQQTLTELMADGALTVAKACEFTSLSRPELYKLMAAGKLPFTKHGKRRLIPRRALVQLLAGDVPQTAQKAA
jgi:excisionase family DNA binding protein